MHNNIVLVFASHQKPPIWWQSIIDDLNITFIAICGQSAFNLARVEKSVDLIILDTQDGPEAALEFCRRLRGGHSAPLLLLTSELTETFQVRAYEAGVDECIRKPISSKLLMAKVNAWLQFSRHPCSSSFPKKLSANPAARRQMNEAVAQ